MADDGRRLRLRRLEAGLTQAELAAVVGCDHSHLSKVERGERALSVRLRVRIAAALIERLQR